jgi:hypothetical protein
MGLWGYRMPTGKRRMLQVEGKKYLRDMEARAKVNSASGGARISLR